MAKSQSEVEGEGGYKICAELLSKTVLKGYLDTAGVLMIGRIVLRSGFYGFYLQKSHGAQPQLML